MFMSSFSGKRRFAAAAGLIVAASASLATPSAVHAQEEEFNTGRVSLSLGTDFATAYFFRGLNQEDSGLVAQPWLEVGFNLYESEGVLSSLDFAMGTWNSIHSQDTGGAGSTVPPWFESDAYFTLGATVFDDWSISLTYTALTSPNQAFSTIHELGGSIAYNDAAFWDRVGLSLPGFVGFQPYVTVIFELDGQADAPTTGGDEGIYMQIGIEPSFMICEPIDLTMSIPISAGFSIDNYYEDFKTGDDEFFGFADVGVVFTMPLTGIIPPEYGLWEISAGAHVLFLGDTAEGYDRDPVVGNAWNNSDDIQFIGVLGFAMSY